MFKLPFLKKSSEIEKNFLVIDIGTDKIKVMAFEVEQFNDTVIANIVGVGKAKIPQSCYANGVILDATTFFESVEKALAEAVLGNEDLYKHAIFGVSGNLSYGLTTTVKIVRGKPGPILEKEVKEIKKQISEVAYSQAISDYSEITGTDNLELELINFSIIYAKVENQIVDDLLGKEGQKVEISTFSSYCPSFCIGTIQQISKEFDLNIFAIGSTMYSVLKSLSIENGRYFDGVLVDIGGNSTDIAPFFFGGIHSTRTFGVGGNDYSRAISKKFGLSEFDAEAKKIAYSSKALSENEMVEVHQAIKRVVDIWLLGLEQAFLDFNGIRTFSSKVYVFGGGANLIDIPEFLNSEPWARAIPFIEPPEIIKISFDSLAFVKDRTAKVYMSEDVVPASLSIIYLEAKDLIKYAKN